MWAGRSWRSRDDSSTVLKWCKAPYVCTSIFGSGEDVSVDGVFGRRSSSLLKASLC
jgi:hypothetical protein